jgi:hypothetical protein
VAVAAMRTAIKLAAVAAVALVVLKVAHWR